MRLRSGDILRREKTMLDGIVEKINEYQDYLVETQDMLENGISILKELFSNGINIARSNMK